MALWEHWQSAKASDNYTSSSLSDRGMSYAYILLDDNAHMFIGQTVVDLDSNGAFHDLLNGFRCLPVMI